ncbi:trem-like transcript 4 protein [Eulemur rufifrons]|uniref:trem-like transcript 4 protein n=1 Tax=Eulemur rufifrons TaxID=859984 RepID=UPI0037433F66
MEGTGLSGGPQLLLRVSGLHAAGEAEEQVCPLKGKTLTVVCPYNVMRYASSLKAWQRSEVLSADFTRSHVQDEGDLPELPVVLTCGSILNKGLLFSVLFVLLRKAWAVGEWELGLGLRGNLQSPPSGPPPSPIKAMTLSRSSSPETREAGVESDPASDSFPAEGSPLSLLHHCQKQLGSDMACGDAHLLLLPVLLVLLASGSWGKLSVPEELHRVPGQTLSVRCEYSPKREPYQPKIWCRQKAPGTCNIVVTSSKPRIAAQDSRHTVWDEPDAGFFNVTMSQLEETDTGIYWCGIHNSSFKFMTILRKIRLVVSPAPTTSPMWTLTWLPTRTVLVTSPEGTSGCPSVNGSETRQVGGFTGREVPGRGGQIARAASEPGMGPRDLSRVARARGTAEEPRGAGSNLGREDWAGGRRPLTLEELQKRQ